MTGSRNAGLKSRNRNDRYDTSPCRTVTPEEAAHYRDKGWVMLRKFVDPAMLGTVLTPRQEVMGEDGDSNPPYGIDQPYFNAMLGGLHANAEVRPLFGGIGQAAKALMARMDEPGVRLFNEFYAPKLPAAKKTINMGNGPTSFHQDFITFAVDRSRRHDFLDAAGGLWAGRRHDVVHQRLAQARHSRQLHRLRRARYPRGLAGTQRARNVRADDLRARRYHRAQPHDRARRRHEPMDRPRWAYLVLPQPADARWNGAPPEAFDPAAHKMTPYGKFPDEAFPIIA